MSIWYLNRLKTFSLAEIPYRVNQLVQKKYEQYFSTGSSPGTHTAIRKNFNGFSIGQAKVSKDSLKIFGREFIYTDKPINWHKDIFSGESFPARFSKSINIKANPNLSAKVVWEINRLQFLPQIALNFKNTRSELYLTQFTDILDSWIDQNPYLMGINWYSNIEINIRLISWFICWKILDVDKLIVERADIKHFVETKWMPAIYQHCRYSYKNPSKYSSANNHLISEYAGLFIASSLWEFKEAEKWLEYSQRGLETEISLQHSSGINREEAAEYIQFITDFFLLCFIVGKKTNRPFSKKYLAHLYQIFSYIYNFLDNAGNFPKYGDEDDGRCFLLDSDEKFNNFKSLLTSGAILFKDPAFKSKSNGFDSKNQFLFGDEGRSDYDSIPETGISEISKFYKDEGHFIFRKSDGKKEIYLHFDAAPLGYLSIAAHGHADALSFILNVDGRQVFVDSGTYTYHTEPEWRNYFIGTLAHNTVRVNQEDQAEAGGPTLWTKHYRTLVLNSCSTGSIEYVRATHDGYKNLNVSHIREITFDRVRNEIEILDTIDVLKHSDVEIEIPFHLHPAIKVDRTSYGFILSGMGDAGRIEFYTDENLNPVVIKGQVNPQILGWYSESFMKKEPTNVVYCKTKINKTTTFRFLLKISDYGN